MMTTIFVAAPKPRTWPLTLDRFAAQLGERWPQAEIFAHHAPVSNEDYLDFQMDLDGMTRTASYYDRSNLILSDGDPGVLGRHHRLVPRPAPGDADAVAMVEVNPEYTAPIPPGADAETIRTLLEGLTEA